MNSLQFNQIVALEAEKSIFGQFISVVSVTDQDDKVKPEFKGKGIVKVSKFQAHVRKDNYLEILNTSTGAIEIGVEFKSKRPSHYNDVAHNGFCRSLKSDPSKLYLEIRYNENDKGNDETFLVDAEGNRHDFSILKEKSKNVRSQLVDVCKVSIKQFKIESIASIKVGGLELIDDSLVKYIDMLAK